MANLKIKSLSASVSGKEILKNIDLSLSEGKIYALMGPNGSGKSTLANAIMGNPEISLGKASDIILNRKSIKNLSVDKRARLGIFVSFQSPYSLSGVTVIELLKYATTTKTDVIKLNEQILSLAKELKINKDLLNRSLNEGASGGERKKLELLQAAVLDRDIMIFDEIDSGVDVDSLKLIAKFILKRKANKTFVLITHYNRILKYLPINEVMVMRKGRIVEKGDSKLAERIEREGYRPVLTGDRN